MTARNLIIILAAVAASFGLFLWKQASAHKLFSRDYVCVVLTDDVVLKAGWTNQVVGTLRKGVVLYVPSEEDYKVTDPSDNSLHKVYVSLTADMKGKFLRVPRELPPTNASVNVCNYLMMYPQE